MKIQSFGCKKNEKHIKKQWKVMQKRLQNSVQYDIMKMYLVKVMYIENWIKKPYLIKKTVWNERNKS